MGFERVKEEIKRHKLLYSIFIGDFNARIANFDSNIDSVISSNNRQRKSKDKTTNTRVKDLIKTATDHMYTVTNGNFQSDLEGEFTFNNNNGSSVMD